MGPSPNHSRLVGLVLNPRTGHVLPQYHIKQDDFFETVTGKLTDFDAPEPIWKRLAGLDQDPSGGQGKGKGKTSMVFPSIRPARETPMREGIPGPPTEMFNPSDEVGNPHLPEEDTPEPAQQAPLPEPMTHVPVMQAPPPRQAPVPVPMPARPARVTRSGRVVKDSTRYKSSLGIFIKARTSYVNSYVRFVLGNR